jgi:molybdate transport system regulatory protein
MRLRGKIWVECEGGHVFGKGRADLLEAVQREGTIQGAARRMGVSYRHAWSMLKASGRRLGRPLIRTSRGGRAGGGTRVTEFGKALCESFRRVEARLERLLREVSDEMDMDGP